VPRRPLIAGNWKMNLDREQAYALATAIAHGASRDDLDVAIFPPALWLADVAAAVQGSTVAVGAQNCWTAEKGAFTGELAPGMVRELGTMVLIGHSERRQIIGEDDALIRAKIDAALAAGLRPILCCGEALDIRQSGQAVSFVERQIDTALTGRSANELGGIVVAYEPIWAIGTGVAATPTDAQEMSAAIRAAINRLQPGAGDAMPILYGGSVNPGNAAELLSRSDVDGALVGGASLIAEDFLAIVNAAPRGD
jgi:triosephosphate isomerase